MRNIYALRSMKFRAMAISMVLALHLSGCVQVQLVAPKADVCIIVDKTMLTDPRFTGTVQDVERVYLRLTRTDRNHDVRLEVADTSNHVIYDGAGGDLGTLRDKLTAAAKGRLGTASNGSDICGAILKPGLDWLRDEPSRDTKYLVVVSDLTADPTKRNGRAITTYDDASRFSWTPVLNAHLFFYMVPDEVKDALQSAWGPTCPPAKFFVPGHVADGSDLDTVE